MAKDLNISRLCDAYGSLLTEYMRETVISYYDYDLSLAEIAENSGVTRQAVLAVLKQAESKLKDFEAVLGTVQKTDNLLSSLNEVKALINSDPTGAKTMLDEIITDLRSC